MRNKELCVGRQNRVGRKVFYVVKFLIGMKGKLYKTVVKQIDIDGRGKMIIKEMVKCDCLKLKLLT